MVTREYQAKREGQSIFGVGMKHFALTRIATDGPRLPLSDVFRVMLHNPALGHFLEFGDLFQ